MLYINIYTYSSTLLSRKSFVRIQNGIRIHEMFDLGHEIHSRFGFAVMNVVSFHESESVLSADAALVSGDPLPHVGLQQRRDLRAVLRRCHIEMQITCHKEKKEDTLS